MKKLFIILFTLILTSVEASPTPTPALRYSDTLHKTNTTTVTNRTANNDYPSDVIYHWGFENTMYPDGYPSSMSITGSTPNYASVAHSGSKSVDRSSGGYITLQNSILTSVQDYDTLCFEVWFYMDSTHGWTFPYLLGTSHMTLQINPFHADGGRFNGDWWGTSNTWDWRNSSSYYYPNKWVLLKYQYDKNKTTLNVSGTYYSEVTTFYDPATGYQKLLALSTTATNNIFKEVLGHTTYVQFGTDGAPGEGGLGLYVDDIIIRTGISTNYYSGTERNNISGQYYPSGSKYISE